MTRARPALVGLPSAPVAFDWRRDALPLVVLALVTAASRLYALQYVITRWNADGGVDCLMARHHWEGRWPIFFYGQSYNGSLEALVAAPFYPVFGGGLASMGAAQVLLSIVLVSAIYRLVRDTFDRVPALIGALLPACGTLPLLENVGGQNHSYTLTSAIGIALLFACARLLAEPSVRRALGAGALFGLGWFNNPQIASFLAPLLLVAGSRGRIAAILRSSAPADVRSRRLLLRLAAGFAAILTALSVACFLKNWPQFTDGLRFEYGIIRISMNNPERHIGRIVVTLAAAWVVAELILATDRRRLTGLVLAFGAAAAAIAGPPTVLHVIRSAGTKPLSSPIGFDPSNVIPHAYELLSWHFDFQLFGHPVLGDNFRAMVPLIARRLPWLPYHAYIVIRLGAMLLALFGFVALLARQRTSLSRLARGQPVSEASPIFLLLVQATVLIALYLLAPSDVYEKYLQPLWITLAAAAAALLAHLASRRPLATLAAGVLLAHYGISAVYTHAYMSSRYEQAHRPGIRDYRDWVHLDGVMRTLEAEGLDAGYANYWVGYRVNYLMAERIVLAEWPEPWQRRYYPPYRIRAAQAKRLALVFATGQWSLDFAVYEQWLSEQLDRRALVVESRRRVGMYIVFVVRRLP